MKTMYLSFDRNVALLVTLLQLLQRVTNVTSIACDPNKLTVYRVYLNTMWSREVFPKQYPEWRPPAQWSKMIGKKFYMF